MNKAFLLLALLVISGCAVSSRYSEMKVDEYELNLREWDMARIEAPDCFRINKVNDYNTYLVMDKQCLSEKFQSCGGVGYKVDYDCIIMTANNNPKTIRASILEEKKIIISKEKIAFEEDQKLREICQKNVIDLSQDHGFTASKLNSVFNFEGAGGILYCNYEGYFKDKYPRKIAHIKLYVDLKTEKWTFFERD